MNISILEEKKNRIVFSVDGETHTIMAALRAELAGDDKVKAAGYHIEHPQKGRPTFVVETEGAEPKKIVTAALRKLAKASAKLAEEAQKELR
jgi:DNA-directed RNA polymerase subunit L